MVVAWNRDVALWTLNKSILNIIIDYGLEGPSPLKIQSGSDDLFNTSVPPELRFHDVPF